MRTSKGEGLRYVQTLNNACTGLEKVLPESGLVGSNPLVDVVVLLGFTGDTTAMNKSKLVIENCKHRNSNFGIQ